MIADKVRPERKDATVYIADIYRGPGLAGIPRGRVEQLRLFTYHYAYPGIGGHRAIGVEGGWEPKHILGTVPVEKDGSALFSVPANTPVSIQPLDEQGRALQLMRSWMTAMPGEAVSCIGCHEPQNSTPPPRATLAAVRAPSAVEPWHGPTRGFSFVREVQPVLDRHCVSCHDGSKDASSPNLAKTQRGTGGFTSSYLALHPFVRRPGPESDYHLLTPTDYHASTSELIQMLEKGHHDVALDAEAWDRIVTWIDLNVPDFGTWGERVGDQRIAAGYKLRQASRKAFAGLDTDLEALPPPRNKPAKVLPKPLPAITEQPAGVQPPQQPSPTALTPVLSVIEPVPGLKMDFVELPAGRFSMGSIDGAADELPVTEVAIDHPFRIGRFEVSNLEYAAFDARHDSRYIDQQHKDHNTRGYPVNQPNQPAVRVTWEQARAFCAWLSERTGQRCDLPTEAQWEYACRAGAITPFSFGELDSNFSAHANLADRQITAFAVRGVNPKPMPNPSILDDFIPRDARYDDRHMISANVGSYRPNPWNLHDMHGNVWEWTRSLYQPYPYSETDGRNDTGAEGRRVARGGSWRDRPHRATASYRLAYEQWQPVFNVGFRVVMEK